MKAGVLKLAVVGAVGMVRERAMSLVMVLTRLAMEAKSLRASADAKEMHGRIEAVTERICIVRERLMRFRI